MRQFGSDGKRATVQVHQYRMRPRPFRLKDVRSQPIAATLSVFQIFNELSGGYALLHTRQEVDKVSPGVHSGIHRGPSNGLTGDGHILVATHESSVMVPRVSGTKM